MSHETGDGTGPLHADRRESQPGVLVVFSSGTAMRMPLAVGDRPLVLGRMPGTAGILLPDERLSRTHAEITRVAARGWVVRDLGSRNGTFVDGAPVQERFFEAPRVIRLADTLLLPMDDIGQVSAVDRSARGEVIVGSRLSQALRAVARAAETSTTLVIQGESGAGKELAARTFHAASPHARGPFVGVNCAAIPEGLAERLLFGAKRGAYSGADADAVGHLQAAHGGVLFLDEVGDLDLHVQAKLLRVLETREVVPLGASSGQHVDVRVCVATHHHLRAAVAAGRFRADLYYRLAPPEVTLPPLRERLDEIPAHAMAQLAAVSKTLTPHARLLEACMLRAWPGNVRELRKELHHAAARAFEEGATRVRVEHLSEAAGLSFGTVLARAPSAARASAPERKRAYVRWAQSMTREQLEEAIAKSGGKLAEAARALGMHRSQLYREMARWSLREHPAQNKS